LIQYSDPRRASLREACLDGDELSYCLLIGDQASEVWLRELLQSKAQAASMGAMLLVASRQAPKGFKAQGKVVCQCFGVTETKIHEALSNIKGTPQETLRALQSSLACGTNCGSCVPELKNMIGEAVYV
jgi:assimilatory nitrate reductase catalytic subunit